MTQPAENDACDRRGPGGECVRDHAPCPDFPGLPTADNEAATYCSRAGYIAGYREEWRP